MRGIRERRAEFEDNVSGARLLERCSEIIICFL